MNYRLDRYGNKISILGYGCMRFTQTMGKIDMAKAKRELMSAIRAGVNYLDTAYVYGGSEAALGEILEKNGARGEVYIATKLPHYLIRSLDALDRFFNEQLRRLRTDHIDYYLMHMLTDTHTWERLRGLGIERWLEEKKKSGAIRQAGFSYHGDTEMFRALLDAYDWDVCMIQYNYMDENSQAGRSGLRYAHEKGLPVVIMEPLRGGKLVKNLPAEARRIFDEYPVKRSPAEWAFRWLWDQPEVSCVLSGMNSLEMVRENAEAASQAWAGELGEAEKRMLQSVAEAINSKMKVGCTACGYCLPCPQGVDIPGVFAAYNRRFAEGKLNALREYMMCTTMRDKPSAASACIGCGKCEKHCPQSIAIRDELKNVKRELEGPAYKLARRVVRLLKVF